MKKTFKICLFIFLFFVVSVFKVNAETTVNYSCDYNFDGIKFRIRVNNLPQQYVKDAERIRSMSNVKSYVIPFYWPSDGSGSYKQDTTSTCIDQYDGFSSTKKKLCLLFGDGERTKNDMLKNFLIKSTKDGNNITCPTLYREGISPELGFEEKIKISSYDSYTTYDAIGVEQKVTNTAIGSGQLVCYNSNNQAVNCSQVDVGQLVEEGTKECTYTANGSSRFKLTFNKKTNELIFESLTNNLAGKLTPKNTETTTFTSRGDGTYLVASNPLVTQFKNTGDKCPNNIACNCKQIGSCVLYDKADGDCGQLAAENGVDRDPKNNNSPNNTGNGDGSSPSSPGGFEIGGRAMTCEELMGKNLTKIFKFFISTVRIVGAIVAIVVGMLNFLPAVTSKDAGELKKAAKKTVWLLVILAIILLLPSLARTIGKLFEFDISCLV